MATVNAQKLANFCLSAGQISSSQLKAIAACGQPEIIDKIAVAIASLTLELKG